MRRPSHAVVLFVAVTCVPAAGSRAVQAASADMLWHAVPAPGGSELLTKAAGITTRIERWRLVSEIVRKLHGEGPRAEPRTLQLERLAAAIARIAALSNGTDTVPLPLAPALWSSHVFGRTVPETRLVREILANRAAALTYLGLAALDGRTLEFLRTHPGLLSYIARERFGAFARAARSLRLDADGSVVTPGGDEAVGAWQDLVGARVTDPDRFIRELVNRDAGRLAYFYDLVAQLPESNAAFALGLSDARHRRLDELYSVVRRAVPAWRVEERPFFRPPLDPATVLSTIRTAPEGGLAPPASRWVWRRIFSPAGVTMAGRTDEPFDAALLIRTICVEATSATEQRDRFETLLFAQRAFGAAAPDDLHVVEVLRVFPRFRALLLALERTGIGEPRVYALAVRQADRLSSLQGPEPARTAIAQFQGAVALVDRAVFVGTLDPQQAGSLVETLAGLDVTPGAGFHGGVVSWLSGRFLPAVSSTLDVGGDLDEEALLIAALAGPTGDPRPVHEPVSFEGAVYRIDLAGPEASRLRSIRRKQGGLRLDAALDAVRAATTSSPNPSSAAPGRTSLSVAETSLADVLISIAYAVALGDPDGPAFLGPDVSRRHDFGLLLGEPARSRTMWAIAEEQSGPGIPWRLTGSIVALDAGLAGMALRRIATDTMPPPPVLSGAEVRAFAESVVWMKPAELSTVRQAAVAAGLRRGRARLAEAASDPEALVRALAPLPLNAWRRAALPWIVQNETDAIPTLLSLGELVRLGDGPSLESDEFRPWGPSDLSTTGCLCLKPPAFGPADAERDAIVTYLASRVPDLKLRVAEVLDERGLPAILAPGVLTAAVRDFADLVQPAHGEDRLTLVREAHEWPADKIEDYVAALAGAGPLAPAGGRSPVPEDP